MSKTCCSSVVTKMIFFPTVYEAAGTQNYFPVVIFVCGESPNHWKANLQERDIGTCRYGFFSKNHTTPYTDIGWSLCLKYRQRRSDLDAEYSKLFRKLNK